MKCFLESFFLVLFVFLSEGLMTRANERCTREMFQCRDKKCIPKLWHCDGNPDCDDNSDEEFCGGTCPPDSFKCRNGKKCIYKRWICDGTNDCDDGDDEDRTMCYERACDPNTEFACRFQQGKCVPKKALCNGVNDCPDASDEATETCLLVKTKEAECMPDEFQCKDPNKACIAKIYLCDGNPDCPDRSDEDASRCKEKSTKVLTCSSDQFKCTTMQECIESKRRCDSYQDCEDGSDEANCTDLTTKEKLPEKPKDPCSLSDDFFCGPDDAQQCISPEWVCDGSNDCFSGLDEVNCDHKTCKRYEFTCGGMCLSNIFVCDGTVHCADQSDERNCPSLKVKPKPCNPASEFNCTQDGGFCIPLMKVCDGHADCPNGADEAPGGQTKNCVRDLCAVDNGECSQVCSNGFSQVVCSCRPGFKLMSDRRTCDDVNECEEKEEACSQTCVNTKGSFKCECLPGYTPNFTDPSRCQAVGEKFLLFATGDSIREMRMLFHHLRPVVAGLVHTPVAIDYDFHANPQVVFWSEISPGSIKMSPLNKRGPRRTLVGHPNVDVPDGLAYDWIHKLLFWTDTGSKRIGVVNVTSGQWSVVLAEGLDEPRAIVVNPLTAQIFWTDWGRKPRIEVAGMNGQRRQVVVDTDLGYPNGMALDLTGHQLYWADAKLGLLASLNLRTMRRRIILHNPLFFPFGLAVFEDRLYWSDWRSGGIFSANKITGQNMRNVTRAPDPFGVRILHELQQPLDAGHCTGSVCSNLCLPAPQLGMSTASYTCACPIGMHLGEDWINCFSMAGSPAPTSPSVAAAPGSVTNKTNTLKRTGYREITPQQTAPTISGISPMFLGILVCAILFAVCLVGGALAFLTYRNYMTRVVRRLTFNNPAYGKASDQDHLVLGGTSVTSPEERYHLVAGGEINELRVSESTIWNRENISNSC